MKNATTLVRVAILCITAVVLINFGMPNNILAEERNLTIYTDRENKFSIKYPITWEFEKGTGRSNNYNVIFLGPYDSSEDVFNENCNVIAGNKPKNMSLDIFAEKNILNQKKYMHGYRLHKRGKTSFAGIHTIWSIQSFKLQGNDLKSLTYYIFKENMVYAVTCVSEPDKFSEYEEIFNTIAQSFR